jgi:hypothetical protein
MDASLRDQIMRELSGHPSVAGAGLPDPSERTSTEWAHPSGASADRPPIAGSAHNRAASNVDAWGVRHHSVDQQLCRWLLMSLDRLASDELTMTQELIANMLGVRREGVTEAAGKLRDIGIISYSRGHIKVLDRAKLEKHVCECYAVVKKEFDRLLSDIPPGEAFSSLV